MLFVAESCPKDDVFIEVAKEAQTVLVIPSWCYYFLNYLRYARHFLKIYLFLFYGYDYFTCIYINILHVCLAGRSQKRVPESLELVL